MTLKREVSAGQALGTNVEYLYKIVRFYTLIRAICCELFAVSYQKTDHTCGRKYGTFVPIFFCQFRPGEAGVLRSTTDPVSI